MIHSCLSVNRGIPQPLVPCPFKLGGGLPSPVTGPVQSPVPAPVGEGGGGTPASVQDKGILWMGISSPDRGYPTQDRGASSYSPRQEIPQPRTGEQLMLHRRQ